MRWGDKILMSDIFSSYLQKLQTLVWKWGRHKFISWPGRNKSTVPSWAHKFSLFRSTSIIPKHLKQGSENTFRFVMKNPNKQFLLRRTIGAKMIDPDGFDTFISLIIFPFLLRFRCIGHTGVVASAWGYSHGLSPSLCRKAAATSSWALNFMKQAAAPWELEKWGNHWC